MTREEMPCEAGTPRMERDTLISLGGAYTIQERLMNLSDRYSTHVCDDCGLFCIANQEKKIWVCKACKSKKVSKVIIPYITKLLVYELYALGIAPRLRLENGEVRVAIKE
jgi:DNA-directed RNA polymerase II subunit RPB2